MSHSYGASYFGSFRTTCTKGIRQVVATLAKIKNDNASKLLFLWNCVAITISVILLGIGGGYAFGGTKSAGNLTSFRVIIDYFPHGLRAHGYIMFMLGIFLVFSLGALSQAYTKHTRLLAKITLFCILLYSAWTTWAFVAAYILNHHYTPGMYWYLGTTIMTFALLVLTPPFHNDVVHVKLTEGEGA